MLKVSDFFIFFKNLQDTMYGLDMTNLQGTWLDACWDTA